MNYQTIFIIVGIVAIIILYNYFFNKKKVIKRKLRKAEFKKIADVKENDIVKIVGNVELTEEPLFAPLSNRICSFYYIHIQQRVSSGKSTRWKTIIEEEVSGNFLIRDENDYAIILDKHIKSLIVEDRSYSSGFMEDATDNLEKYLNLKGLESEGFLGMNKTLRYFEGVLEDGEELAVFGKGNWTDFSNIKLHEKSGKVLVMSSQNDVPVYLSDDPSTTIRKAEKRSASRRYNTSESNYRRWASNYRKKE